MCLVIGEAYRRSRGFMPVINDSAVATLRTSATPSEEDARLERQRVALTAIYLGYGIMVANRCFPKEWRTSRVATARPDFLDGAAASYALSVLLTVRGTGFWERRKLARHLNIDAAAYFAAAWKVTSARRKRLTKRLGLAVPEP